VTGENKHANISFITLMDARQSLNYSVAHKKEPTYFCL